jgi:hypothetical protein
VVPGQRPAIAIFSLSRVKDDWLQLMPHRQAYLLLSAESLGRVAVVSKVYECHPARSQANRPASY